jgi:hypothetical protein
MMMMKTIPRSLKDTALWSLSEPLLTVGEKLDPDRATIWQHKKEAFNSLTTLKVFSCENFH